MSSEVVKSETLLAPPLVEWRRWTGFDLLSNRPNPGTTKPSGRWASDAVRTVLRGEASLIIDWRFLWCCASALLLGVDLCGFLECVFGLAASDCGLRLCGWNELCAFG